MTQEERLQALRVRQLQARQQAALKAQMPDAPGGVSTNSAAVDEFQSKGHAMVGGALDMMSLGMIDEMRGVGGGLQGAISGEGFAEGYTDERDRSREMMQASQEAEPAMYGGGQVLGGLGTAALSLPLASGKSLLGTAMRGAGIGAAEGAAYGAGSGENLKERLSGMVTGGALGGVAGMAAPAALRGAVAVKDGIADPITGAFDTLMKRANKTKANRAIADSLGASGQSGPDIAKMIARAKQQGQPEFTVADAMGTAGQRRVSGLVRSGGDTADELTQYLQQRQAGQSERVGGFVDDAFDTTGTTAKKKISELTAARSEAANTAYDAARGNAAPVDVRTALSVIDQRIGGMEGSNVTGDAIDGKLAAYRQRLAADPAPDGEIARELSDFDRVLGVKQSIQDDIGAAVRAGRNNEARELKKLADALDGALENSSDMYRTANDGFREASKVIDAVDQGTQMSTRGRHADNVTAFQAMNPEQQGAARIGYGDDLLRRIEANTAPTANKAKVLQSPKRDAEAGAMALKPDVYAERLQRENTMWETQNRALGGSKTADNLQDIAATGEAATGLGGAVRSAANFQFGDAAAKTAGVLAPVFKGQNEATRQLIAQAMLSDNVSKALGPALQQKSKSEMKRRLIEALIRGAGRAGSGEPQLAQ